MPQLPSEELDRLKPALKRLRRQRRKAQKQLQVVLKSSRHLKLITALQGWLLTPRYTALGAEPLEQWLLEWQWPAIGTLLLHRGWRITNERSEKNSDQLHALRKEIKSARYRLENLQPQAGAIGLDWIHSLKQGQELLGELNDLAVLRHAIQAQSPKKLAKHCPVFHSLLERQQRQSWEQWQSLAAELQDPRQRSSLVRGLLDA